MDHECPHDTQGTPRRLQNLGGRDLARHPRLRRISGGLLVATVAIDLPKRMSLIQDNPALLHLAGRPQHLSGSSFGMGLATYWVLVKGFN